MRLIIALEMLLCLISLVGCVKKSSDEILVETIYYPDGKIKETVESLDSIPHGNWISYYPNGYIKTKHKYRNGIPIDTAIAYYESGKVRSFIFFQSKNKSYVQYFYENGNVEYEGSYLNSLKQGWHFEYYAENSKLISSRVNYVITNDSSYDNIVTIFDKEGNIEFQSPTVEISKIGDSLNMRLSEKHFDILLWVTGDFDNFYRTRGKTDSTLTQNNWLRKIHKEDTLRGIVWDCKMEYGKLVLNVPHFFSYPP